MLKNPYDALIRGDNLLAIHIIKHNILLWKSFRTRKKPCFSAAYYWHSHSADYPVFL